MGIGCVCGASRGPLLIDATTMKHWIRLYQHRRNRLNRLQQRRSCWNAGIPRKQLVTVSIVDVNNILQRTRKANTLSRIYSILRQFLRTFSFDFRFVSFNVHDAFYQNYKFYVPWSRLDK